MLCTFLSLFLGHTWSAIAIGIYTAGAARSVLSLSVRIHGQVFLWPHPIGAEGLGEWRVRHRLWWVHPWAAKTGHPAIDTIQWKAVDRKVVCMERHWDCIHIHATVHHLHIGSWTKLFKFFLWKWKQEIMFPPTQTLTIIIINKIIINEGPF